jgi:peptidoglycan/LPS O-acetylase OafA/YrhL
MSSNTEVTSGKLQRAVSARDSVSYSVNRFCAAKPAPTGGKPMSTLRQQVAQPQSQSVNSAGETSRIPSLDGWRGIAILLVLIDHGRYALRLTSTPGESTGHHGVTLFFVLSGFLITSRLVREKEKTGRLDLRKFYLRRVFRLTPCAWVFLAFATLVSSVSVDRAIALPNIVSAVFFYRNYDYLFAPFQGLTGHFWSLSIEEQFYLFWPTLLILAGFKRSRWIAIAGAVAIAAYRWHNWSTLASLSIVYTLGTHLRADALLVGCAAALFTPRLRPYLRAWMALPLLTGMTFEVIHYHSLIPLHESALVAMLLMVTSSVNFVAFRLLDWKPLTFLGTISYGLYVWQQPFMAPYSNYVSFSIAAASLLAIAVFSHYCIEEPFIAMGRKLTSGGQRRNVKEPHEEALTAVMVNG